MPSTTEIATEPSLNADIVTQKYTSFKSMSDSTSSVDCNDVKSQQEEINGDQSLKNSIVSVSNGEELDILIKMERANKEMETNNRSAQSILLSTNSVGSGTANNSPPSQTLSRRTSLLSCDMVSMNDEEVSWELWNQIITDWPSWSKKKSTMKEYIRKGIPVYLRPLAWQYLCGADLTDAKEKYREYLKKQSACEKIIRRDIDRTYPAHEFFRNAAGQESLFNMMKAYSIHDPEVGYCQGSAFICGLLLIQNIPEEEAFAIFVQIMQVYEFREIYKPNMYHLGLCMFQLDTLLQETLPDLHSHFVTQAFQTSMYSSGWFLTLFTTSLPLTLVCRIFDIFLNEGIEIIFRVGIAILEIHKEYLLSLDMEGMLKYFQKELPIKHENDHESILNRAFTVKYNPKKMKKLEKDFSILKKEEQEEQIEMRRLRAENKLLKQRIDNLEKESANLAERLIKGQVVNAQNAECIFVLKNENTKLKDKIAEMEAENEKTIEFGRQQQNEKNENSNEMGELHAKIEMLMQENKKLRETPDNQRLEEELVQVKMREAEAQLAIKELQKTIHVLNLEYQEFLNNRSAAVNSLNSAPVNTNVNQDYRVIEEELLKVKMREAETQSEMKSVNLRIMQLDTEKQVAYNQIKRKDEEFRSLSAEILQMKETGLDTSKSLMDYRRQVDDKDALLKELKMTHKLQEIEDAQLIAELKQRVASLEVQLQELVTTGQLQDNEKHMFLCNGIGASTDKLGDFNDDMKYLLMSSNTSLTSEFFRSNQKLNRSQSNAFETTIIPSDKNRTPVNPLSAKNNSDSSLSDLSSSLSSIPTKSNESTKEQRKAQSLNRSRSNDEKKSNLKSKQKSLTSNRNSPINESSANSDNDNESDSNKLPKSGKKDEDDDNVLQEKSNMEDLDKNKNENLVDQEIDTTILPAQVLEVSN